MTEEKHRDPGNDIDINLMLRVKGGDAEALTQLISRHQDAVYSTVSNMLRFGGDVDDVAQQVFIQVWKGAATYTPTCKFTTWLFTIVRNLALNEIRRQKRKPFISSEELEDKNGVTLSIDESPSPDMLLDHAELNKAIEEAIASLSPQAALAIQLRRFENLSYEEIATILEITVPATKSLIFRARQSLKEKLASFLNS